MCIYLYIHTHTITYQTSTKKSCPGPILDNPQRDLHHQRTLHVHSATLNQCQQTLPEIDGNHSQQPHDDAI